MRNDLETREIADAELDAVSGGTAHVTVAAAACADVDIHGPHAPHMPHGLGFVRHAAGEIPGHLPALPVHVPAAPAVPSV